MSTTRPKTTARADAPLIALSRRECLLTLWVAAVTGIVLLLGALEARAAMTSQVVGTAVLLQASSISASTAITRIGVIRAPRDNVRTDRDAILLRGLMSSPLALPPLHPRATRRYETTTVASLTESRRPQLVVEVEHPRVHVKRRETPVATPIARRTDDDVQTAAPRDAWTKVSSRRGPPLLAGRRTA